MAEILDIQWLYDAIMAQIEPDLVTATIPTLDEKYAEETPAEKKARAIRYADAFEVCDHKMEEIMKAWNAHALQLREEALETIKTKDASEESAQLSSLDQAIDAQ